MVSVIAGIHCHMIMHAFLEIIYKMSIHDCVGYCVFVLVGNKSAWLYYCKHRPS